MTEDQAKHSTEGQEVQDELLEEVTGGWQILVRGINPLDDETDQNSVGSVPAAM